MFFMSPDKRWSGQNLAAKKEWATVNTDLKKILNRLRGTVLKKLEKMCDLISSYGVERFGIKQPGMKHKPTPPKSRRQPEIEQLIKERWQLRKQWKKASADERTALNLLDADLKVHLVSLQQAENLRTQRKRKEKVRTSFYKDPFIFVKSLFSKEKSGSLKEEKHKLKDHLKTIFRFPEAWIEVDTIRYAINTSAKAFTGW